MQPEASKLLYDALLAARAVQEFTVGKTLGLFLAFWDDSRGEEKCITSPSRFGRDTPECVEPLDSVLPLHGERCADALPRR